MKDRLIQIYMMKVVPVRDSIGCILGHDFTRVVPGAFKGAAFRKGHVVREEDISDLLAMGKENIYVYQPEPGEIHEDEAARRMAAALGGGGLRWGEPLEGKVMLAASRNGLLRVYRAVVEAVNSQEQAVMATLHDAQTVVEGETVAGVRVIPLVVPEATVAEIESIAAERGPALEVKALRIMRIGVIVTGNEVFGGRIRDSFAPRVQAKLERFGNSIARLVYLPDGAPAIARNIKDLTSQGMELILVCGGMSVDADDTTPAGIRQAGAEVIVRGTPVFPGAMFMLAYLGEVPVMGLPACIMHDPTTVFDLLLPRLLAGEKPTRQEIASLGVGGLCRHCQACAYPACSFGK